MHHAGCCPHTILLATKILHFVILLHCTMSLQQISQIDGLLTTAFTTTHHFQQPPFYNHSILDILVLVHLANL